MRKKIFASGVVVGVFIKTCLDTIIASTLMQRYIQQITEEQEKRRK